MTNTSEEWGAMTIKQEREIISGLLDNLEAAIVRAMAQHAALKALDPKEEWGPMVLRAEGKIAETLRGEFARLRTLLLGGSGGNAPAIGWESIVRNLVESAKDIDLSEE